MNRATPMLLLAMCGCISDPPVPCWLHLSQGYTSGYVVKSTSPDPPWDNCVPCDGVPPCAADSPPVCAAGVQYANVCAFMQAAAEDSRYVVMYDKGECH